MNIPIDWNQITSLLDIGKVAALLGIPYLIGVNRGQRRHFELTFEGSNGQVVNQETGEYEWGFVGIIKNRSRAENTIVRVYLVVWKNRKKNSYLRFGFANTTLNKITNSEQQVYTPLYFKAREAMRLAVRIKSVINGTADEKILSETIPAIPGRTDLRLPKHNYQLCFEDIDGNFFDQKGRLVNIDEANLWWTLENTFICIKERFDFMPLIRHLILIVGAKIRFSLKLILWQLGL